MSTTVAPRSVTTVAFLVALAVAIALVAWQGVDTMADAFVTANWRLGYMALAFVVALAAAAAGWAALFPSAVRPRARELLFGRWISFAVNQLLPSAQVGGEIVAVRLLWRRAPSAPALVASVLADKTMQIGVVVLHGLAGIALLLAARAEGRLVLAGLVGSGLLAAGVAALYVAQRRGAGAVTRRVGKLLPEAMRDEVLDGSDRLERAVDATYASGARLVLAALGQLGFRALLAAEVWIALRLLGSPASYLDAVVIEGVAQMVRSAAFVVPAAIGAQEAAFLAVGAALGIPAPVALSASLFRRAREIVLGLPALAAWQWIESARFLRRAPRPPAP